MAFFKCVALMALASQALAYPSMYYGPAVPAMQAQVMQAPKAQGYYAPVPAMAPAAEPELPPKDYKFQFDIKDGIAGNSYTRTEAQKDGVVRGSYSYVRPDGVLQTVQYTADETGFHSDVIEKPGQAAPSGDKATHSINMPDVPETLYVAVTKDELRNQEEPVPVAAPALAGAPVYNAYQAPQQANFQTFEAPQMPQNVPAAPAMQNPSFTTYFIPQAPVVVRPEAPTRVYLRY